MRTHVGLLLMALAVGRLAAAPPPLRICVSDSTPVPAAQWQAAGLSASEPLRQRDALLLRLAERATGEAPMHIALRPARRCELELRHGAFDGLMGLSETPERTSWGRFPRTLGLAEAEVSMNRTRYAFYAAQGSAWHWDGKAFQPQRPRIGIIQGLSGTQALKALNLPFGTTSAQPAALLRMVLADRFDVAMLPELMVAEALQTDPTLAARIRRLDPPLATRHYHLVLAPAWVDADPARARRLWLAVGEAARSNAVAPLDRAR